MYDNMAGQGGVQRPPMNPQPNPFDNAFYGAGSGLIRGGLGAYGERFFGSSSEFMQSNISRYFSNPQYYFQVNDQYVKNKLKVVLFPFLHRGHWTRITEPVGGRLSYKPPVYDINAPDLYIPLMAFGTYVILAGFTFGLNGKFSPEALSLQFTRGLIGWVVQFALLKGMLFSLGGGEAPLLDIVAYGGYAFAGICLGLFSRLCWNYSYYFVMSWMGICMAMFLVKTMKRVLFTEMRNYERHPSRQNYLLLFMGIIQLPLFFFLGKLDVCQLPSTLAAGEEGEKRRGRGWRRGVAAGRWRLAWLATGLATGRLPRWRLASVKWLATGNAELGMGTGEKRNSRFGDFGSVEYG